MTNDGFRPLEGRTVLITRALDQVGDLADGLADLGATVLAVPTIAIADPADGGAALRTAAASVDTYDWVIVTSPNGADRLLAALSSAARPRRIAAIGPGTARRLRSGGLEPDLVPARSSGEGLLAEFSDRPPGGGRVLLARAAVARDVVPDGLRARGWVVDVVEAYRTIVPVPQDTDLSRVRQADTVVFTSSSTVRNFVAMFGAAAAPGTVCTISPVTSATARALGLTVTVEATDHTIPGVLAALAARSPRS